MGFKKAPPPVLDEAATAERRKQIDDGFAAFRKGGTTMLSSVFTSIAGNNRHTQSAMKVINLIASFYSAGAGAIESGLAIANAKPSKPAAPSGP